MRTFKNNWAEVYMSSRTISKAGQPQHSAEETPPFISEGHIRAHSQAENGAFLAISPDGRYLASGGEDKVVTIWNLADGQLFRTLPGLSGKVRALAFGRDGHVLAGGGWGEVVLWDATTWTEFQRLPHEPPSNSVGKGVNSVAFSQDGRWLATGGQDRTRVRLWRTTE